MSYTIVGLFPSQEFAKPISEGLENNGFRNEDYIIYHEEKKQATKSFWSKFFTESIDEEATSVDSLIVSVAIKNEQDLENAKKVFNENKVVNKYILEDVNFEKSNRLRLHKKSSWSKSKSLNLCYATG